MSLTITSIGSSSRGNCYVLDNGETRLFLEAGISLKKIQQQTGFSVSSAVGCLVTHGHL